MSELAEVIKRFQENGKVYTNDYSRVFLSGTDETKVFCTGTSVLMVQPDHGVNRIGYYTVDWEDLSSLMAQLDGQEYVFEFLTRDANENRNLFEGMGFEQLAQMQRLANKDCRAVLQREEAQELIRLRAGYRAEVSEAHEINRKLWDIFDTRISHLLSDSKLEAVIKKGGIMLERSPKGIISAILQFDMQPKRFYINQIYNEGESRIIHSILLNQLSVYCAGGGKYLYAWVESGNTASLKFHRKYGMEPDGMYDMVYVKRNR